MRKNVFGRQFSRDTNQRKSLFKSLLSSLILQESIETTLEKAKAIKADADKIINLAKRGNEKLATQHLQKRLGIEALSKVIKDLAPRLKDRTGGYTRIIKLGRRFSDNAAMVMMEWVVKPEINPSASSGEKLIIKNDVKELPVGKIEKKQGIKKESKRKAAEK
ncbi:MAG: 50S ribosomal protein L17 [Candidatus Levybacteria bacterium GW2011_GWA2_37_36]|nr:MAG: 50S ribosomal protein L17 [Candidatus Levybacteria bacterium GW2011_GWA1_37_16]KKQ33660.1 MAG: 50S ribosomal protein L17 [Candidatus Levybacteria bacterium GW2011_GWA2_37_36]KKQ37448.1 MAG: 50S ribosomal protein L17 [Candidatus Levybacteria bacterium GW2011_GWC2_37_7]KKQ41721.1 MAG: 50S ribosomal protein L17 [Candidatus Levybacteria bacterium GW2011_GWB1_37_8]OGH51389.1 MAG: 50S ribosomal protein L17 [Candidatus Levybacteria bacterium RIFCSPLOWO2_12_FULL_37_14]